MSLLVVLTSCNWYKPNEYNCILTWIYSSDTKQYQTHTFSIFTTVSYKVILLTLPYWTIKSISLAFFEVFVVRCASSSFGAHSNVIDVRVTRVARRFSTGPGIFSVPSSKHWIILPPYAKQSTGGCGTSPRHNDWHFGATPRRTQQAEWSRPPAAHFASEPWKWEHESKQIQHQTMNCAIVHGLNAHFIVL